MKEAERRALIDYFFSVRVSNSMLFFVNEMSIK